MKAMVVIMVYRVYVEKKADFAAEAASLAADIRTLFGIKGLSELRILNRYDIENIDDELFSYACKTVFSEPATDIVYFNINDMSGYEIFAVEYLPGQFDQRADSAAQCIQLISKSDKPLVRSAKVYLLKGELSSSDILRIKKHIINPVESREATLLPYDTLSMRYELPTDVDTMEGFIDMDDEALSSLISKLGLAMDIDDIRFCKDYFVSENRNPTITEIKMIDTYWSDHCRHTTFNTIIDDVKFEDPLLEAAYERYLATRDELSRNKPICLMDIATIATKHLKVNGMLDGLDESDEINACTVKIKVQTSKGDEDWLLLFKNETHNHPTEIEPFGGAATCVGGAIRDPLSGRSYVYAAMRVTGAADPLTPIEDTIPGKLPQRKIVTTAANGYSSYGNQIGIATGLVDELYHPGYAAKRMEIGAVIAAAPRENVRRESPVPGDAVILIGGRTGRDGCGGATGSSKSHTVESLTTCGAEVQKGNAPEERKLQRLFRKPEASRLIKRCNDFGAGGVSVAIGELADGLIIDLNKVPKKYEGLDGTELAISESQERMAVVVDPMDVERFLELALSENLEATVVAAVTEEKRLILNWNGKRIVDLSREFLNSNGASKHIIIAPKAPESYKKPIETDFHEGYTKLAKSLSCCSRRGLSERFDSTIGSGTVLMPFGGKYQNTPIQSMVHLIPVENDTTDTCSFMSYGYNPYIAEKSPYHSAYLAVIESVSKLIATGASFSDVYLTFQEYFLKLKRDEKRWGLPFAALLGAFMAQMELKIAAIGGKDSMSGTFENLNVPPTLVSFAVTTGNANEVISPEFKRAGNTVCHIAPLYDEQGLPVTESLLSVFSTVTELIRSGKVISAYTPTIGGVAEAVMKMCFGNMLGFRYDDDLALNDIFDYSYGSFVLELTDDTIVGRKLGQITDKDEISLNRDSVSLSKLLCEYEGKLEPIYTCNDVKQEGTPRLFSYVHDAPCKASVSCASPRVLIPVFPGTNCEYDSAKAMRQAGASPEVFVIKNLRPDDVSDSVCEFAKRISQSQIIMIPGGFSGGDEPDGSGKFITAFFRNGAIKDEVHRLLKQRDGLMLGICNGFQALIKLGLVPYGEIIDTTEHCPTLTYNCISRHQSMIVKTRIASNKSPWLMGASVGDVFSVPISHGEGRFICSEDELLRLSSNGQIATQYVDENNIPTMDIRYNPNGSIGAVEGILSPDGRIFGKMGHSERTATTLYKNVYGNYDIGIFRSAVEYFK